MNLLHLQPDLEGLADFYFDKNHNLKRLKQ